MSAQKALICSSECSFDEEKSRVQKAAGGSPVCRFRGLSLPLRFRGERFRSDDDAETAGSPCLTFGTFSFGGDVDLEELDLERRRRSRPGPPPRRDDDRRSSSSRTLSRRSNFGVFLPFLRFSFLLSLPSLVSTLPLRLRLDDESFLLPRPLRPRPLNDVRPPCLPRRPLESESLPRLEDEDELLE
jgi:hypothetical protein